MNLFSSLTQARPRPLEPLAFSKPSFGSAPPASLKRQRGMSLMEILVALVIMAMIVGIGIPSLNFLTHLRLRDASTKMAGTIRYLYNQAALKGLCMRIVFDLRANTYRVETSTDGNCLVSDEQVSARDAKRKEEEALKEAERKKKETTSSETTLGGWGGEKPISLEVKQTTFAQINEGILKARPLGDGISFHGVYVDHQADIYSQKQGPQVAYFHCFPLGRCQRAVIYLQDSSEEIFSLEVKPLTGRVIIHKGKIDLLEEWKDRKKGEDNGR